MTESKIVSCDLLVVGSGAGGLSAAVTAAKLGLKVIVVEKEPKFGGTTAWSGGWMWIPRNPLAVEAGINEDIAVPLEYLRHELREQFDERRARVYLENGPRMVEFFRRNTLLQFSDGNLIPDFHGNTPGAAKGGRSVCAAPFDGRRLGKRIVDLKPPLDVLTLWGMNIASGADLKHFYKAMQSFESFAYVTRRVLTHWKDLALHGRGLRLVNGNALVAALAATALENNVQILVDTPALRLLKEGEKVCGAVVGKRSAQVEIRAARGVVLACGGFPHDVARKKDLMPHAPTGNEHWSAASLGDTGDGLRLGESAGGRVSRHLAASAGLAPVSLVPRADGTTAHFPHLLERGKPGLIAVTRKGRRFVNEANPYYDFVTALLEVVPNDEPVEAWLLCDDRFVRAYGLGAVKPAPVPMGSLLRNGYIKRASTVDELGKLCGIESGELSRTVADYNRQATRGVDELFGKGDTPYNKMQGDASWGVPNPCMAPLVKAPFYAVRVVPGSLGTFAGLLTNLSGQALNADSHPIPGLYASGNDASSMMGGYYPSGGITLGPAMTFGYIIAHHAAGVSLDTQTAVEVEQALH